MEIKDRIRMIMEREKFLLEFLLKQLECNNLLSLIF